jgi:hypothetical protein
MRCIRQAVLALAAAMATALAFGPARASAEPVRFLAFGDMPYVWPKDLDRFGKLIEAGNRLEPDFMVHLGDIKGGGAPCTEDAYRTVLELLERSEPPLIYTPGDNEWTDCRRPSAGSYDPAERLAVLRRMFFPPGRSLGRKALAMEEQSRAPDFAPFVENRRWRMGETLFATLHLVGSNNNYGFDAASDEEHRTRMRAVFAWMDETFALAKQSGAGAVVLLFQADPLFEIPFPFRSGFNAFIAELEREAKDFAGPVLIVHGDSHRLVLDRPVRTPANRIVTNLVRLVVPGAYSIEGVLVSVDPAVEPPFAFARVPGGEPLKTPWGGS